MCRRARRWKKHDLETDATCLLGEMLLSRVTPSSLTCGENGTVLPATLLFEREESFTSRLFTDLIVTDVLEGMEKNWFTMLV